MQQPTYLEHPLTSQKFLSLNFIDKLLSLIKSANSFALPNYFFLSTRQ